MSGDVEVKSAETSSLHWRTSGGNRWLSIDSSAQRELSGHRLRPEVLPNEDAVGEAMLDELRALAARKKGTLVVILLGGRGAQALHRKLSVMATSSEADAWIARLHVFMQDALAPMPASSTLSFIYDFRRLLGEIFLRKVGGFHVLRTDATDLAEELKNYIEAILELGGPDIFFLGHGPEPGDASHFAYVRPGSGAQPEDVAGIIPIATTLVEHHIAKFRAGGIAVTEHDEQECQRATDILTFGPAMLLASGRIVQSIVDADTAPAKKRSYRRLLDEELSSERKILLRQLDDNPGLWIRMHPNVRSLVLPNLLAADGDEKL